MEQIANDQLQSDMQPVEPVDEEAAEYVNEQEPHSAVDRFNEDSKEHDSREHQSAQFNIDSFINTEDQSQRNHVDDIHDNSRDHNQD